MGVVVPSPFDEHRVILSGGDVSASAGRVRGTLGRSSARAERAHGHSSRSVLSNRGDTSGGLSRDPRSGSGGSDGFIETTTTAAAAVVVVDSGRAREKSRQWTDASRMGR